MMNAVTTLDIPAVLQDLAVQHRDRPLSELLASVADFFSGQIFDQETVAGLQRGLNHLLADDILAQVKKVGDRVDNFSLTNVDGAIVSLDDAVRKGPVVVVFYRGLWCPYCNLHLNRLQQWLPAFQELNAGLIAISPQSPDKSLTVQEKNELAFPVLSDIGSHVARSFGVAFEEPAVMSRLHEEFGVFLADFNAGESKTLPIPATFVIDRNRIVRWVHADVDYTRRSEPAEILDVVRTWSK